MKNRKINFLKLGIFLFGVSFMLWNCDHEESLLEENEININDVKTVSFKEAMAHFDSKKKNKIAFGRGTENSFEISPDWSTLEHNQIAYTDAQLTTAGAEINREGNYSSELSFINVNNHLVNAIVTTFKDDVDENGNMINGKIFFNDLDGKFLNGYKIEGGIFTKRYVVQQS